jgi:NAD(P)H-dependent flavin oxidoreductase YrpB (nitropropane dioxygenase family)
LPSCDNSHVLTTPLCRRLGIEAPVLSVGFGAGAPPELAAAVSNAGGLGVVGLSGATPEQARAIVAETRALTERPFGANLILDSEPPDPAVAVCLDAGVPVLVLFWDDPAPYVGPAHAAGAAVLLQVGSVEEAVRAAEAGVDGVIAQGVEAGGHVRGTTGLSVLVPAIVDAIAPVAVIASGGIADGRGLAAALVLGAQAVSLGTRFVASTEAYVAEEWKQRIVDARAEDAVYSADLFDNGWEGAPHRMLRNEIVCRWEADGAAREHGTIGELAKYGGDPVAIPRYRPFMATPSFEGDLEEAPLWAGQSAALVHEVRNAGDIVAEFVRDAEAALYSLTTYSNDAQQTSAKITS